MHGNFLAAAQSSKTGNIVLVVKVTDIISPSTSNFHDPLSALSPHHKKIENECFLKRTKKKYSEAHLCSSAKLYSNPSLAINPSLAEG